MGGSSAPKTQTTTSQAGPWSEAVPYYKDILGEAEGLYNSKAGSSYFPGQTVADYSGTTRNALSGITGIANQGQGSAAASNALGQANTMIGQGGYNADMSQASNQYKDLYGQTDQNFNSALDFQMGKVGDDLSRRLSGAGVYGGGTQGSDFAKVLGGELAGQRASAASNNFNSQQQQKLAATSGLGGIGSQAAGNLQGLSGLLPGLNEAQYYDRNQQLGVGQAYDAKNQEQIQAAMDKFNAQQAAPWQSLNNYIAATTGTVGGFNTTKSTAPAAKQPSTLQTLLGGGLGLAGLL